jgi:GxxExxY protein
VNRRGAEHAEGARVRLVEPEQALNRLTEAVIGAAIEVHRVLGPGFLESLYENALCVELVRRAIPFVRQAAFPVLYKGTLIGETRLDMLVDGRVLVELKATAGHASIHLAQVLSYLSATGLTLGLLINFNVLSLRHGIRRVVRTPTPQASSPSAFSSPLRFSPEERQ